MTETVYLILSIIGLIVAGVILEIQSRQIKKLKKEIKRLQSEKQSNITTPI